MAEMLTNEPKSHMVTLMTLESKQAYIKKKPRNSSAPDRGWAWLVLVAAFMCNVIFDGIIFSFGILYMEFLDYFKDSKGVTSWIGSVISGTYAVVGPLSSILANKYGCRAVTIGGSLIASAGFFLSSFMPNVPLLIITFGLLGGIGFGLMYLCAYVMVGYYFRKRRAFATGLTSCGSGVGTFIFAPLTSYLIELYTWKGTMWILAGIVLNGVVFGAIFRPPPEVLDKNANESPVIMDWSLLKRPVVWLFCMSSFLCMIGFFVPFIYLPSYAVECGFHKDQASFLISIIGIVNMVGRIATGWVSDRTWSDPLKIYNFFLILGGAATCCVCFLNIYGLLATYSAIFGLSIAVYVSLCAIILIEFLGIERLSNSFGLLNMFRGIATFIGAPLAGFLFDATGDFKLAFYIAGAGIVMSGVVTMPLRMVNRCEQTRQYRQTLRSRHKRIPTAEILEDRTEKL